MRNLLILLITIVLASCSTYDEKQIQDFDQEIVSYIEKNKLELENSESGLHYRIINPGEGERVQAKDKISFTYKGSFLDGTVFDEQKEPVSFYVSELIGAWKEIVLKLNEGGEAYLIAPPQLGYGARNLDDIPPNSILVYTLKVHQVE